MAAVNAFLGDYTNAFATFGALAASYIALKFLLSVWSGIKTYFLAKTLGLSANLKNLGQWAVVTGATDGIGKAYAQELARIGLDIVLISRNPEKLGDVAAEIETKYKVKTKCVPIDFTGGPDIYAKIDKEIGNLEIGVLVNNVGMSYGHPEYVSNMPPQTIRNIIAVNISSVTEMTQLVLPAMEKRRKGAILNIASAAALSPTPLLNVYSATKSFVKYFSEALDTECKSKGITVQCVMPFFVATKLSKIRRTNIFVPSPTNYVKAALTTVGVQSVTFGCLMHALQGYVVTGVPSCVARSIGYSSMKAVRAKALKRLEQEQKGQ